LRANSPPSCGRNTWMRRPFIALDINKGYTGG
jgi:hypothetical protein